MQLQDRVFLITGAGSGLGAAVAEMVVTAGGKAVLLDINAEAGSARAEALGPAARFVKTDVTSETDGQAAVAAALDAFGRLDGLVNCAGIAPGEKILGREGPHGLESFTRAITINLIGTFNMLRLAAEAIVAGAKLMVMATAAEAVQAVQSARSDRSVASFAAEHGSKKAGIVVSKGRAARR